MSDAREDRLELSLLHWQETVVRLLQEHNTLALESLSELRDIARDVKALADALPQPLGQLKSQQVIFAVPI